MAVKKNIIKKTARKPSGTSMKDILKNNTTIITTRKIFIDKNSRKDKF
jgi:hypothetical protein